MKTLVQKPGESPEITTLDKGDTLKGLQGLVGGYITTVYVPQLDEAGITIWANDEGLLIGQSPNLLVHGQPIVGPVVFTGSDDEGGTIALTVAQEELARRFLEAASLNEAQREAIALRMARMF